MKVKHNRRAIDKIKFPIGVKLITIISLIVLISLGSITAFVSWLVQEDLRISAEENNFEINRRSSAEAETTLLNIRSNSRILIQTVSRIGIQSDLARETIDLFYKENRDIAAVFFVDPVYGEHSLLNNSFLLSQNIDEALIMPYFQNQTNSMARAIRGETIILNAAPIFNRPVLSIIYPTVNNGVGITLFSSETLNYNFGFSVNQSYMINTEGDILAHSDFSLLKTGINIRNEDFIKAILNAQDKNKQQLVESEFKFMGSQRIERIDYLSISLNNARKFLQEKFSLELPVRNESDNKIKMFIAFTKINVAGITVITGIEYEKVFESINATTRRNIYLTIAVLCISIILILIFAKSISVPLRELAQAARQIEGGVFELNINSDSNDEIGVLTTSFQKMSAALNVFGRFTNKEIAVKAMKGEIKTGGQPKHATIFFSDIRDFTAKSENITNVYGSEGSDKIVFWLNNYLTQMVEIIEKTNGVVDKFIGDAVMAHWGTAYSAGSPRKDAFNCIKAALMMRKTLFYMNRERRRNDPANPVIKVGCGINTGIVTAGQLGSERKMEYTVIGDPVNIASRIESVSKVLKTDILISEDTWRLVGDLFITEEMPSVMVKGKEKPLRIFAVVNIKGERKGPKDLNDVRELLDLKAPDLDNMDANIDGTKFKILKS